ncbi:NAD(P)H-binding protein [Nocardia sp. NPDC004068]|uniref:NmrA family NAD(P)-binding protein n=1 Tax=Nocardia sp. NPDC004068 TaxID=3364303 RepID=UPI00369A771F
MIVITAPTGNIGRQVLANVLAGDQPVRVIVRDPARLPADVRDRVEIVRGSHGDAEVVARAFDGADTLFWLLPPDFRAPDLHEAFVGFSRPAAEALREAKIQRVVSISALGRGTAHADRAGHVTASLAMDDLLMSTGVAYRALALPSFMDNLLRQVPAIAEQGMFFDIVDPERKAPTIAVRDIAAIAARLLLDATWTGQREFPALGPEDLSLDDMAAIASDVLGTPVRYKRIPVAALEERMRANGASDAVIRGMVEMMTAKDARMDGDIVRTPQHALDAPTTFREWCADTLAPAVRAASRR